VRDIRVAIVGTEGIARVHAAALRSLAVLAAASDVDAGRLADFAQEHGVGATYGRLDDLLREARSDLVHICTPPHAHHGQALACLRAGVERNAREAAGDRPGPGPGHRGAELLARTHLFLRNAW
jgi:predicted dehydrogenase